MKSKIQFLMAIAFMLIASVAYAQVPQMFNYQGIARDAKGNPLSNQKMSLKLSVLPTADATVPEYEETQLVSTNEFGLYTLQIGNGTPVTGEMKTVKWETGNKYIKVAIDPTGGTNYTDAGTSQLLSVPYAIYADKAGVAANGGHDKTRTGAVSSNAAHVAGDANYITKFTALNTIGKSLLYDNGTSIALGSTTPPAGIKMQIKGAGGYENIRMENTDPNGFGKFTMYNDNIANYATFSKYGSTYAGGYPGVASQYPYANLLTFGNNNGAFLMSTSGNIGIATFNGTTNLKFNAHVATGYLGLGGPFTPAANVHINNGATGDTLKITTTTSGHLVTDGMDIRMNGASAEIMNRENSNLDLGTNNASRMTINNVGNVGIGTNLPTYRVDVLHGGSTGIRSKSTAGFSVVDIDGFNGDAALRFQENGVGRWNTRNQPGTNDYEIFQLSGGGQRMIINSTTGNVGIGIGAPTAKLDVNGQIRMQGGVPGAGKLMTSDATGIGSWSTPSAAGLISGSGTLNTVPKFTPDGTTLGNSMITDNGTEVGIGVNTFSGSTINVGSTALVDTPSVGFYNTTGGDLGTIFLNGSGQLQFTPNTSSPASGTPTLTLDDDGGGATFTENVAVGGRLGVGTNAPNAQIHAIAPAGKDTAIFATTASGTLVQVGVYGTYNVGGFGAGVVGRAFGGADKPANRDIGVYGTSSDIAVWSNGKLKVLDGTQANGRVLTSDATGTASWSGPVSFAANTSGNIPAGTTVNRIYTTEEFDLGGNNYNPATGIYTVPMDGVYHFNVEEAYNAVGGTTTQLHISFMVNGVFNTGKFTPAISTTFWGVSYSRDFSLVAGDQIQVRIFNSTSGVISTSSPSVFSGHLVR